MPTEKSFPYLVYQCPGPHRGPKGHTHGFTPAKNQAELEALKKKGWFETLQEAVEYAELERQEKKEKK